MLAFNIVSLKWFKAKFRYAAWLVILASLLIPLRPAIGNGIISIRPPVPEQNQSTVNQDIIPQTPQHTQQISSEPTQNNISSGTESSTGSNISLLMILAIIWVAVGVSVFSYHIWRYFRLIRMVKRWGKEIKDEGTLELFDFVKKEKGLGNVKIDLIKCNFVSTTLLTGFIKPIILMPEKHFDEDELDMIFRHELTHYKRKDLIIKLLSVIVISMHWFNPIVYWMCNAIQTEGEASCDETVLHDIGEENRQFYAELIIEMVGGKKTSSMLSTCFYGGKNSLKRRLDSIMDTSNKPKRPAYVAFLGIILITLMSGSVFAFSTNLDDDIMDMLSENLSHMESTSNRAGNTGEINILLAREIALATVGGGTIVSAVSEEDVYRIEILYGDKKYEINIDSGNGEIIEYNLRLIEISAASDETSDTPATSPSSNTSSSRLSMEEISQLAIQAVGGGIIEKVEYEYKNGSHVYEVKVRHDRVKWEIKIDGTTGDILKQSID